MKERCTQPAMVYPGDLTQEADLFRALSDPHRLKIIATLARVDREACVCDFTAGLPLVQPTISHHLKVLKEAGLVESRRDGTWVHYRLTTKARLLLSRTFEKIIPPAKPRAKRIA